MQDEQFDVKLTESWFLTRNHVGLLELKAPALHATKGKKSVFTARTEGKRQNLTNKLMPIPSAFA